MCTVGKFCMSFCATVGNTKVYLHEADFFLTHSDLPRWWCVISEKRKLLWWALGPPVFVGPYALPVLAV